MSFDPTAVKLGRVPSRHDPKTFQLVNYLDTAALPPAPSKFAWDHDVSTWPMYRNDQIGDCTCAEVGHHEQLWTAASGHEVTVTDDDVLRLYESVGGYRPGDPSTDQGAQILDVMNAWRKVGIAGHKIYAFAQLDPGVHELVKDAIYLVGGLSIGVALPTAAQDMGTYWRTPHNRTGRNAPGSWGGHCVYVLDYDRYGVTCVSWGELIRISWGFWNAYVEEAWAPISVDFLSAKGTSPQGFNLQQLQADLSLLGRAA